MGNTVHHEMLEQYISTLGAKKKNYSMKQTKQTITAEQIYYQQQ